MSIFLAILSVVLTVLSGAAVYAVGQIILKWFIEPVHDMKRTIGQISQTLIESRDAIYTQRIWKVEDPESIGKEIDKVSMAFKKLSAQLHAHMFLVPWHNTVAAARILPRKNKILSASADLMWLSKNITSASTKIDEEIHKRDERVCNSLGVYFPDDRREPEDDNNASTTTKPDLSATSWQMAMKIFKAMSA